MSWLESVEMGDLQDIERGDGQAGARRGVVGFDGSLSSFHALAFACGWARRTGSELVITMVTDFGWPSTADAYAAAAIQECTAEWIRELKQQLTTWMRDESVAWTFLVRFGRHPDALEQAAASHGADAIIIGRSRRRRFRRATSARLTTRSQRIVIAVP